MSVVVERLMEASEQVVAEINALYAQLQQEKAVVTLDTFMRALVNGCMIVAKSDDRIVGIAFLGIYDKPFGRRGIIEDVVVDEQMRGRGLGEQIMRALLAAAREHGVEKVSLTSSDSHTAAHRLYAKLGFQKKDTNVFRLAL